MSSIFGAFASCATACGSSDDNAAGPATDGGNSDVVTTTSDGSTDASNVDAQGGSDSGDASIPITCLPDTTTTPYFTIEDMTKCAVAAYTTTTPTPSASALWSWGRQNGPLLFDTTKIIRVAAPTTQTGALTPTSTTISVSGIPGAVFYNYEAVDIPFFEPTDHWTAISYTTSSVASAGEIIFVDETGAAAARYNVNGLTSVTPIGSTATDGRLLTAALSPLASSASGTVSNGIYAADTCGNASSNPRFLPASDATCNAPIKVDSWNDYANPIAIDPNGNAFAAEQSSGNGNFEIRAFEKTKIARNAPAVVGTTFQTLDGYSQTMAADGASVYVQPTDGGTSVALDVVEIPYTVDSTAHTIAAGTVTQFLKLTISNTPVSLFTDAHGRLWVAVSLLTDSGTGTQFFVIADKP